jgi:hypothetical protein
LRLDMTVTPLARSGSGRRLTASIHLPTLPN